MNLSIGFKNYNGGNEDAIYVYRDTSPTPDSPLPTPLATLPSGSNN
jgi:hypothetical protein